MNDRPEPPAPLDRPMNTTSDERLFTVAVILALTILASALGALLIHLFL